MGQVNCHKHYLSLRKSLVLYAIAFVVLAVFLSVDVYKRQLLGLSGGSEASGNAGANGFFRVIGAQGFEPGEPLLVLSLIHIWC